MADRIPKNCCENYCATGGQEKIRKMLIKFVEVRNEISIASILELILLMPGNWPPCYGAKVFGIVEQTLSQNLDEFQMEAIKEVLCSNDHTPEYDVLVTFDDAIVSQPNQLHYKQLEKFKITITENMRKAKRFLKTVSQKKSSFPLYIDTENVHFSGWTNSEPNPKLALITICDIDLHEILIWRVAPLTHSNLEDIKKLLARVAKKRKFATFDEEKELFDVGNPNIINLQQRYPSTKEGEEGLKKSLKAQAREIGITLRKTETVSNWAQQFLRPDQVQYAAMDARVLHFLYVNQYGNKNCWLIENKIKYVDFVEPPPIVTPPSKNSIKKAEKKEREMKRQELERRREIQGYIGGTFGVPILPSEYFS
uniref:3'-5' exonuclease domain-containing protein n=2 Tax=Caenorhabditis tropicalis TaxID=1561998 RepID=A0A1I7UPK4_9PELO